MEGYQITGFVFKCKKFRKRFITNVNRFHRIYFLLTPLLTSLLETSDIKKAIYEHCRPVTDPNFLFNISMKFYESGALRWKLTVMKVTSVVLRH